VAAIDDPIARPGEADAPGDREDRRDPGSAGDRFGALRDAIPCGPGSPLRVVTLPHLVLFKLYAGGPKSRNDVLELLSRNPELDLNALRDACRGFRLDRRLDAWLRELKPSFDE
jgi:hypothetical protein